MSYFRKLNCASERRPNKLIVCVRVLILAGCAAFFATTANARVTRLVITQTRPLGDGRSWGSAGPYERLDGIAYFEIDPNDLHNSVITDIRSAPVNARGMVEFSSPFYVLKPVDFNKGNRKLFYGINNRGGEIEWEIRFAPGLRKVVFRQPLSEDSLGDGLLLRLGYTYVDAGWQGDGPGNGLTLTGIPGLFPTFPTAKGVSGAITGPNRLEFQPDRDSRSLELVPAFRSYAPAELDNSTAQLTVKDREDATIKPIPSNEWAFGKCSSGAADLQVGSENICLFTGFKAGKIYDLTYTAKDPIVMGLAFAVTRDLASFLKFQTHDDAGNPNPLRSNRDEPPIKRAYAAGSSSTGMYSREFLYLGFNADENGNKVFDGVTLYAGGTYRLFANVRFSNPTFFSSQDQHQDYTSNSFPPFTYGISVDPISGIRDGILKRPETDPLVMQVDGPTDFWNWHASLNVTDSAGRSVPLPANARLYYLDGATHGDTGVGIFGNATQNPGCQYTAQSADSPIPTLRALVVAMDNWADRGVAPPPSRYPSKESKGLVTVEQYDKLFPAIPSVTPAVKFSPLSLYDYGPGFGTTGGVKLKPVPHRGKDYLVLLPRPDRDGNDAQGVRQMEIRVPIGTNVGWNVRRSDRAPDLCTLTGSYFPFASTKAERLGKGDPRLSLEERYKTHEGFVNAIKRASTQLVREGFLLQEDADRYIDGAEKSGVLKPIDATTSKSLH